MRNERLENKKTWFIIEKNKVGGPLHKKSSKIKARGPGMSTKLLFLIISSSKHAQICGSVEYSSI